MPEVRFSVDQEFIDDLKKNAGVDKVSKLTSEALTLYNWALSQAKQGRVLVSANPDGSNPERIVTPTLEQARPK